MNSPTAHAVLGCSWETWTDANGKTFTRRVHCGRPDH